jgi:hypothetical protein
MTHEVTLRMAKSMFVEKHKMGGHYFEKLDRWLVEGLRKGLRLSTEAGRKRLYSNLTRYWTHHVLRRGVLHEVSGIDHPVSSSWIKLMGNALINFFTPRYTRFHPDVSPSQLNSASFH